MGTRDTSACSPRWRARDRSCISARSSGSPTRRGCSKTLNSPRSGCAWCSSSPASTDHLPDLSRLSLNQATVDKWTLREAVDGCVRHGIGWIGPWRHRVQEVGMPAAARMIRDAGLRVSSLCRGGWVPAPPAAARQKTIEDNLLAVDEAAGVGDGLLRPGFGAGPGRDVAAAEAD